LRSARRALKAAFPGMADDGLPEMHLLHARYVYEQREGREREVLARYSKDGRRPQRSILAATQVIEQSLDVDFDLLITDLAPIDLLLQRLGRLYRHLRGHRPLGPDAHAWICKVDDVVSRDMFGPGSDRVYAPHLLLRSWLALEGLDALRLPEDVERLVEAVYDFDRTCPTGQPVAVQRLWAESYAALRADMEQAVAEAKWRYIRHPGYSGDVSDLVRDSFDEEDPTLPARLQMQTRLGDPTISVVFLYRQDGGASCDRDGGRPVEMTDQPNEETTIRLLRRSMAISDRRIVAGLIREGVPSPWSRSPFLRYHRLLLLDQDNTVPVGRWRLRLDDELGLVVDESREGGH
jgi:CRISPR-associated endonuclease/helicase Cas3